MYNISEMIEHSAPNLKLIEQVMDSHKTYHPEEANIYNGLKRSVERELHESLRRTPLQKLIEFLTKPGSTSTASGAYMVAAKVSDILYYAAKQEDLTALCSAAVVDGWAGSDLNVALATNEQYKPQIGSSGGAAPQETADISQSALKPKLFTANIAITGDLLEDNQYGLLEWHVANAGKAIGQEVSDNMLKVIVDSSTVNAETASADETLIADINDAFDALGRYRFIGDTLIVTPEVYTHSLWSAEVAGGTAGDFGGNVNNQSAPAAGFDTKFLSFDTKFSTAPALHAGTEVLGDAFTDCHSILMDRKNAVLTGRKRWLQIERYADPIKDLTGAVVTARANSVLLQAKAAVDIAES